MTGRSSSLAWNFWNSFTYCSSENSFKEFYPLNIEQWYSFYVASGPRYSYGLIQFTVYSAEEKRVSLTELYTTVNLFSSHVFLMNILSFSYDMSAQNHLKVNMIIFYSGCYLRYLFLISPYRWGLRDLTVQFLTVNSVCPLNIPRSDTGFGYLSCIW